MDKKRKFYTVWIGRQPGIYSSWQECNLQIHGFEKAVYKSFPTLEQATIAFNNSSSIYISKNSAQRPLSNFKLKEIGEPIKDSICVDGAWNTQTNIIEYQGVKLINNELIFHAGPFNAGTNNIAEFLAIVHALSYCKSRSLNSIIYSDSQTAITWIKKKKAATKIKETDETEYILSVLKRAEQWLGKNKYTNEILKWETVAWGENPADFGRK